MLDNSTSNKNSRMDIYPKSFFWLEFFTYWLGGASAKDMSDALSMDRSYFQMNIIGKYRELFSNLPGKRGARKLEFSGDNDDLVFCQFPPKDILKILEVENFLNNNGIKPIVSIPVVDLTISIDPPAEILKTILASIQSKIAVELLYISKTSENVGFFSPHSIVKTSSRVHCRGWWQIDGRQGHYTDLILSRMVVRKSASTPSYVGMENDTSWREKCVVEAKVNDKLPSNIRDALIRENGGEIISRKTTLALAIYVERELLARRVEGFDMPLYDLI